MKKQFPFELSHLYAMIRDIRTPRTGGSGRIADSSFFRIPAVKSFEIISGEPNELLRGSGMFRKMRSQKFVELHESNERYNEFMIHEIKFLRELLKIQRQDLYGAHVEMLMKRSIAFRTSAFNKTLKGGYKDLPLERIYQITYGMNKLLKNASPDLKYFRVNIPKDGPDKVLKGLIDNPGGKYPNTRPLGVPTAPGRIILHMGNGFLVIFLEEELKKFNHAYTPNVGTMTCLKEGVTKVLPSKYIYEFDLKGFFNNVKIGEVVKLLQERGMPWDQALRLNLILNNIPANLKMETAESDYDKDLSARDSGKYLFAPNSNNLAVTLKSGLKLSIVDRRGTEPTPFMDMIPDWAKNDPVVHVVRENSLDKGLPQGAAPSTTLSLLVLIPGYNELKSKGINLLMYADDGFLYSDSPFEPFAPKGLAFAAEKSFWVRRGTEGLIEASKFLGVKYLFKEGMIEAKTRKGSELKFGEDQFKIIDSFLDNSASPFDLSQRYIKFEPAHLESLQTLIETDLEDVSPTEDNDSLPKAKAVYEVAASLQISNGARGQKLVNSGIGGLALSKLYGGNGGKQFYPDKAEYSENSFGGRYYDIKKLERDRRLQRLASTVACEGLLEHMTNMSTSIHKARKYAQRALRYFRANEELKLQFRDLRAALELEHYWDEKELSLVPYESESQQSFNSRSLEPVRLTKRERATLRRNLMSKEARRATRPNAPIVSYT